MNKLSIQARAQILTALSEGLGINAACRMTQVKNYNLTIAVTMLQCDRALERKARGTESGAPQNF